MNFPGHFVRGAKNSLTFAQICLPVAFLSRYTRASLGVMIAYGTRWGDDAGGCGGQGGERGLRTALGAEFGFAIDAEEAVVHGDADDAGGRERRRVAADHAVLAGVGVGVAREFAALEQ